MNPDPRETPSNPAQDKALAEVYALILSWPPAADQPPQTVDATQLADHVACLRCGGVMVDGGESLNCPNCGGTVAAADVR